MKTNIIVAAVLAACLLTPSAKAQDSSGKTAQKLLDMVVGTWTLDSSYNVGGKKDVKTIDQASHKNEYPGIGNNIEFTRDAKYIVRGQTSNAPSDSGFYRANEEHKLIYLQSSVHQGQPMEWHASIKNGRLTLSKPAEHTDKKKQQAPTYVYQRRGNSAVTAPNRQVH